MLTLSKNMGKRDISMILTVPPLAKFKSIAEDPVVESVRLNTTLPLTTPIEDILNNVKTEAGAKPVWIDLKTRQLRIADYNVKFLTDREVHSITLSHKIKLNMPAEIFIDNANYVGTARDLVNDNTLVIENSVEKGNGFVFPSKTSIGIRPGMSVNILDPSLVIDGYFTDKDKRYIEAAKKLGMNNFMLSFVEQESDITELLSIYPKAKIIAKIESKKGLEFIDKVYPKYRSNVDLMAARGDLYTEVDRPDEIIDACSKIRKANRRAVFASRMLESIIDVNEIPKCSELFDVYCGMLMGYKRFMMGDDVCARKDSVKSALGLFEVMKNKYQATKTPSIAAIISGGLSK
jgi:hypothetical protein